MINKLFKNKKNRYRNLLLVLLPFILLIGFFGFTAFKSAKNLGGANGGTTFSNSIDSMDYHLRANATDYQKDLFKELNEAVKAQDKEKIAEAVVKNYVADFYTWTNKGGSYDVGGMYYVYSPSKSNIVAEVRDKFYKYVSSYIEEYGSENLLEVENINITGGKSNTNYEFNGKVYDSYFFTCEWTYKDNDKFDTSKFVTKQYFNVIENEDGRFEIVQAYGDF